ncbi:ATP phosphoribosyltransferase regulatory subunit [Hydrogenivirga sp.]
MSRHTILPFERLLNVEESALIKKSILKASEVFERWGYDYLKLPAFDHYEVHARALGDRSVDAIVLKDTEDGELVSLRADFTTQVVRSVSFFKVWHFPLRLYYFGTLFSAGRDTWESFQTGIELIGVRGIEGDAEVISAIGDFLKSMGLKGVKVNVGHVRIVEKLLSRVNENDRANIRRAFKERNLSLLRTAFGGGSITKLPLIQDRDEALSTLSGLGLEEERAELEELGEKLEQSGVDFTYDLSEVRDFPYYTGVVFEFFHPDLGAPLAGGGRYDRLSEMYGADFPATGGSVYVDKLLSLLTPEREEKDFFVIDLSRGKKFGFKLASLLRSKGYKVGRDLVDRALGHSLDYAFSQGYVKAVVVVDEEDVKVYTTVKDYTPMTLKEFLKLV